MRPFVKILLCVSSYLPNVGGREVVLHQLASSYQKLGHEVRVAGPGSWWKYRGIKFGYPLYRLPRIPLISNDSLLLIQLLFIKLFYNFDIIHAHSTYPNGYAAARLKNILKRPIIITPHGEDIHVVPEINFGDRLDPILDKKIQYALKLSDFTTSISDSVTDSIVNAGVQESKIKYIPNGVDLERFKIEQDIDVYTMFGIPKDSKIILSIGNYHPRKGHEVLIESVQQAIKQNPKIRLLVVGKSSDILIRKVQSENLDEFIKFTGQLKFPTIINNTEPDILVALMQHSDIYITASIGEGSEGLSLALLEAMSSGLCIIATDISGNRDIINNDKNGIIVPPSSPEEMCKAILNILADENKLLQLQDNARETVQEYGWIEIAKKYISLYESCIR